jgi:hypothetical protein
MATIDRRGVSVDATDTAIAGSPNPGLAIKAPCLVATTGNITLLGLQAVDGVMVAEGNRVLVWQQADATLNGPYNASSGDWTRTVDARTNDQFAAGLQVVVASGATYARLVFQLTSPDPVTLGTTAVNFGVASVPSVRRINTTTPLQGGGDLTADRTLSITPNGIGYGLLQQVGATRILGNPSGALATAFEIGLGATLVFAAGLLATAAMTGDVAASQNSFVTTIQPHVVSNSKFRQSAALSLVGNASNATADVADIAAASDNQVLRRSGTALGFGAINLASTAAVTGTLASANGGTDNAAYAVGDLLQASAATPTLSRLAAVATGNALISGGVGVVSAWGKIGLTTHIAGTLAAANGGTGATSLGTEFTVATNVLHVANNGITYGLLQQVAASSLVGNPTGSLANAQAITLGATLAFSGSALQTAAGTGDISWSANSFITAIGANKVTSAQFRQSAALSVVGVTGNATANVADIAGTANQVLRVNSAGTALGFGSINLASTAAVTGTLPSANGGTDNAAYAIGDLLQASATTPTLSRLAAVATGNALISGGVNTVSSWGKVGLTTHITGTLAATNGGTGATSLGSELTVATNVLHVANNGITYGLLQQVAASSLVGNATAGLANATGITLGATLAFSASALQTAALTGDVTASANSFATTVSKIAGTTVSGTTGSGNVAFSTSPSFTTPSLGAATATSINGVTLSNSAGTAFSPTLSSGAGSLASTGTTASVAASYILFGKLCWVRYDITWTTNGTASGRIIVTLPFTAVGNAELCGHIWSTAGQLNGIINSGLSLASVSIYSPSATYPGASGNVFTVSGWYEIA